MVRRASSARHLRYQTSTQRPDSHSLLPGRTSATQQGDARCQAAKNTSRQRRELNARFDTRKIATTKSPPKKCKAVAAARNRVRAAMRQATSAPPSRRICSSNVCASNHDAQEGKLLAGRITDSACVETQEGAGEQGYQRSTLRLTR